MAFWNWSPKPSSWSMNRSINASTLEPGATVTGGCVGGGVDDGGLVTGGKVGGGGNVGRVGNGGCVGGGIVGGGLVNGGCVGGGMVGGGGKVGKLGMGGNVGKVGNPGMAGVCAGLDPPPPGSVAGTVVAPGSVVGVVCAPAVAIIKWAHPAPTAKTASSRRCHAFIAVSVPRPRISRKRSTGAS
jgi:hypothetical protein